MPLVDHGAVLEHCRHGVGKVPHHPHGRLDVGNKVVGLDERRCGHVLQDDVGWTAEKEVHPLWAVESKGLDGHGAGLAVVDLVGKADVVHAEGAAHVAEGVFRAVRVEAGGEDVAGGDVDGAPVHGGKGHVAVGSVYGVEVADTAQAENVIG